jgi:hypothetical protein
MQEVQVVPMAEFLYLQAAHMLYLMQELPAEVQYHFMTAQTTQAAEV